MHAIIEWIPFFEVFPPKSSAVPNLLSLSGSQTIDHSHSSESLEVPVNLDPGVGFEVGTTTAYIGFCHRLTPHSVTCHLAWSPLCDWKGLISMCGTTAKAEREVA